MDPIEAGEDTSSTEPRPRRWRRNLLGVVISLACLGLVLRQFDISAIRGTLTPSAWPYLMLGLGGLAFGYVLRIWRWALLLRAGGAAIAVRRCAGPYLASIALNNVLPMRIGDVLRGLVFPASLGVRRAEAVTSLVVERLLDLMTLLACLGATALLAGRSGIADWVVLVAVAAASAAGLVLALLSVFSGGWARYLDVADGDRDTRLTRLLGRRVSLILRDALRAFGAMSKTGLLLLLVPLSVLAWTGEATVFFAAAPIFGFRLLPAEAVLVMAMAVLSTLVPSSPGYVGTFHLAAFSGANLLGATPEQSAGFAVLVHLAVWLPTTLAGAVAILAQPALFRRSALDARAPLADD
jgi:uncharacterized protein (TIRG00374 family)